MDNKFEDFFKEKFREHEEDVKDTVWKNVQTALKGAGLGFLGKTIINKLGSNLLVVAITTAAAVIGGVAIVNYTGEKETQNTNAKTNTTEKGDNSQPSEQPALIVNPTVQENDKFFENKNIATNAEPTQLNEQKLTENKSELVRLTKENSKKKISRNLEVASIFASPVAGTAPLIVSLTNTGNGAKNKWQFSDKNSKTNQASPIHVFDKPGEYEVTLTSTNEEGITAIDKIKIEVKAGNNNNYPVSVFTPNADGVNDYFVFQSKNIVKMKADIFDINGTCVFSYAGIDGKWDGRDKHGDDVIEGLYYFAISATDADGKIYDRRGAIRVSR
jgi:gliding motility-associated-like protein